MASGIGTIVVRTQRGKVTVQGMGQTPRGQKFIRQEVELQVKSISDPAFKGQMETAVAEIMAQQAIPSP